MKSSRILFPATGFTLADAASYYRRIARWLLPHLRARPLSFRRYPGTIDDEAFWEKDAPSFTPKWVQTFPVARRGGGDPIDYIVINDAATLRWVVSVGGIELHSFLHRAPRIDVATSIVFDLDPGRGVALPECCEVALILRDALDAIGLASFAKVSGSKGLQVYVPLNGDATHEATETFARLLATELARRHPKRIVAKMAKELRSRKVLIDWSQNAGYKTTVAVYSLRTKRERPYVSMPVTWNEVEAADGLEFEPEEAIARVRVKGDLFKPVLTMKQELPFHAERASKAPKKRARGRTQSGRRRYAVVQTEQAGDELWLELARGQWSRWILRADREKKRRLIALHAGHFGIDPKNYHGATFLEHGTFELVEGSIAAQRLALHFAAGELLAGSWRLHKLQAGKEHRSWALEPATS